MVLGIPPAIGPRFRGSGSSTTERKRHPRRPRLLSHLPRLPLDGSLHRDPNIQYP